MSSDYQLEDTVYLPFTTRAFATGIPTALVSGEVQIYEDASVTQITAAETLTVSLDSIAGFNMVAVVATAANGFGAGQSYTLILSAGTVDSVSAIGEVIGHFTLDMSAAAKDLANATDGLGAIKAETALIVADTAVIGVAGAGLTDLGGMSTTMKAQVNTEADTALTDYDPPTNTEMEARTIAAASYFDPTTDAVASVTLVDTVTTYTGNTLQTGDVTTAINDLANATDGLSALKALIDSIIVAVITNAVGADVSADIATAQSDLDAITGAAGAIIDPSAANTTTLEDAIWDAVLTGAAHNDATSAGRRLRQIQEAFVVHEGTADAGAANTIDLETGVASTTDDIYNGDRIVITGGTGAGEHGLIVDYDGVTNQRATISENWVIQPDATSIYEISPASVDVETVQHVIQTAGDLAALLATAQADLDIVTGAAGVIIDDSAANDTTMSDAIWDEDATGHQTQGTFGQAIGDPVADATTIYQSVATDATGDNVAVDVVALKAETVLIVADTNELQGDWVNTGRLDTILDTIAADTTTDIPALIATAQADLDIITDADGVIIGAAGVNLFWNEAMVQTTGAPAVTGTFRAALQWMFALSRNKMTTTATTSTLRNDADGADLSTSTISDDTTTAVRGEWST